MPLVQADQTAIVNVSGSLCHLNISADFGLSALLNLIHFQNFGSAIGNATCCDLVMLIPQAVNTIAAEIAGIVNNISSLAGVTGLLSFPTSLSAVIKWVANLIGFFISPILEALIKKIAMLASVVGEVTTLATGIEKTLANLGGCAEAAIPNLNINIAPLSLSLPGGQTIGHDGFNVNFPGGPPPAPTPPGGTPPGPTPPPPPTPSPGGGEGGGQP